MARYIDADKIRYSWMIDADGTEHDGVTLQSVIEKIPTADVVEAKYGEWFLLDECANGGVYCSVCYKKVYKVDYANQKLKSKFCPNCGARMDGKVAMW